MESTETFDQVYARLDAQDSFSDIEGHLAAVVKDTGTFSAEHRGLAQKALNMLTAKVAAAPSEQHLAIARSVRTAYRSALKKLSEDIVAEARKKPQCQSQPLDAPVKPQVAPEEGLDDF